MCSILFPKCFDACVEPFDFLFEFGAGLVPVLRSRALSLRVGLHLVLDLLRLVVKVLQSDFCLRELDCGLLALFLAGCDLSLG